MRIPLLALSVLPIASLANPASALPPQDLVDLVPESAHLVVHGVAEPSMAFIDDYTMEVFGAVRDARFDEMVIEIMEAAEAPTDTLNEVKGARDMIYALLGSVDWYALVEQEVVFAQRVEPAIVGTLMPSMIVAGRPAPEHLEGLERSLSSLMATVGSLAPGELRYRALPASDGGARIYKLEIMALGEVSIMQLAVDDERVVIGMGDGLFGDTVALMEGRAGGRIVDSPRFLKAMGQLPDGCGQMTYVDMNGMLGGYRDGLVDLLRPQGISGTGLAVVNELHDLVSVVDTVTEAVYAEGSTLITESWVRYDDEAAAAGNPILAGMRNSDASEQLMEFIPYNATSFAVRDGYDLAPLYNWSLDRYREFVPEAEAHMIAFNGVQAALDLDIEEDVLSWIGSPSVSVTLPPNTAGFGASDEWVSVMILDDTRAAKKCISRFESVFTAIVPPALELVAEEAPPGTMLPKISIEGMDSPTGLRELSVQLPMPVPIPPMTYGVMGRLFVSASSEEALEHVLATAAGEVASVWEHELADVPGKLPGEPVVNARLIPWGQYMRQLREALMIVNGVIQGMAGPMLASSHGEAQREGKLIVTIAAGVLSRLQGILEHIDFLEHGVAYTVARDEGRVHYIRSATKLLSPEERAKARQVAGSR